MKVLVIDSHKSKDSGPQQNLHWRNARTIADDLGADLIWSFDGVNDHIRYGYERIVFVHASHYAFTDYAWIENSPDAELFYITNEYNLGEPRTLWMAAKEGRNYTVIANHPPEPSKVVKKYVKTWRQVNLNALSFTGVRPNENKQGIVYYGNFRKSREKYFRKYLTESVCLSTHPKNYEKFLALGCTSRQIGRISWPEQGSGLDGIATSLYIEDEVTHEHFNFMANRYYEALNHNVQPIFDESCRRTVELSGLSCAQFASCPEELVELSNEQWVVPADWSYQAHNEKEMALCAIYSIVKG